MKILTSNIENIRLNNVNKLSKILIKNMTGKEKRELFENVFGEKYKIPYEEYRKAIKYMEELEWNQYLKDLEDIDDIDDKTICLL